jgi:hypothetical protein
VKVRVGASVLTSKTAGLATGKHNLRGWPRTHSPVTAYKISFAPSPHAARQLKGVVHLAGYDGGYIGACAIESGNASACWRVDEEAIATMGADWRAQLGHIARGSPAIGDLLLGARFLTERPAAVSGVPFGYKRRAAIAPNVYPLGDQLCVIPSFTGDGTSLALSSGVAAARAYLAGTSADAFQRKFLAGIRAQFFWASVFEAAFKSGAGRAVGIRVVAAVPPVARLATSLTRVKVTSGSAVSGTA